MHFAILGILIIVVIGFFVVLWKAASAWRWYNIVAACITMLLAVGLMFPTALILKSRSAWHELHEKLEIRAADEVAETKILKYGDPLDPAGKGVVELSQELAKIGIESGRRWRRLGFQGAANGSITLAVTQPITPVDVDPDADAAANPGADLPLIPVDMVVYGFGEDANSNPAFYIGEFRVTASTPTGVTLQPTGPIPNTRRDSWSLYELLPVDGHLPFIAEGSQRSEENLLGRVNDGFINTVLAGIKSPEVIKSYLEDGRRVRDTDPELSRWVQVQFTKPYKHDVDSPDQRGALDGGYFDVDGRAVDSRLQKGGQVEFKVGDEIVITELASVDLVAQGIVEVKLDYYLRPLNDYRFVLGNISLQLSELAVRKKELENEIIVNQAALDATINNFNTVQVEKLNLEQDLAQTEVERGVMTKYRDQLRADVETMQAHLLELYRQNLQLENELKHFHRTLEERINAVTINP